LKNLYLNQRGDDDMKKKIYTRPVCIMLSQEMYEQVSELTEQREISVSDYIREALTKALNSENNKES
jgi:Arc/MetJ-type ribon-helix-helix transcriptional regulator